MTTGAYPSIIDNLIAEAGSASDGSDSIFMPFRVIKLTKLLANAQSLTRPYAQFYTTCQNTDIYQVITVQGDTWLSTGDVFTYLLTGGADISKVRVLLPHADAADSVINGPNAGLTMQATNSVNNGDTQPSILFGAVSSGVSTPIGSTGTRIGGCITVSSFNYVINGFQMVASPSTAAVYAVVPNQYIATLPNASCTDANHYSSGGHQPQLDSAGNWSSYIDIIRSTPFANAHYATYFTNTAQFWQTETSVPAGTASWYWSEGTVQPDPLFGSSNRTAPYNVSTALNYWDILPTQAKAACCANNVGTIANLSSYCDNYFGNSITCTNIMTAGSTPYCSGATVAGSDCMSYCNQSYSDCDKQINTYAATLTNAELLANPQLFACHMNNANGTPNTYLTNFYSSLKAGLPSEFAATIVLQAQCVYPPCSSGTALLTTAQKTGQTTACQNYSICYQKTTVNNDGTITGNLGINQTNGCQFATTGGGSATAPVVAGTDFTIWIYLGVGAVALGAVVLLVLHFWRLRIAAAAAATK